MDTATTDTPTNTAAQSPLTAIQDAEKQAADIIQQAETEKETTLTASKKEADQMLSQAKEEGTTKIRAELSEYKNKQGSIYKDSLSKIAEEEKTVSNNAESNSPKAVAFVVEALEQRLNKAA